MLLLRVEKVTAVRHALPVLLLLLGVRQRWRQSWWRRWNI